MGRNGLSLFFGFWLIALAAVVTACGGGGGGSQGTAVLPAAQSTAQANTGTGSAPVAVAGSSRIKVQVLLNGRASASARVRAPKYINDADTDTIKVIDYNGSTQTLSTFTIPQSLPAYNVNFVATASQPCQSLSTTSDFPLTQCVVFVSASLGDTLYVTASCSSALTGIGYCPADLSSGVATVTSGSVPVVMDPIVASASVSASSSYDITCPSAVIAAVPTCQAYFVFESSSAVELAALTVGAADGAGRPIPGTEVNTNLADPAWSPFPLPISNGGYPTVANTEPLLAVAPTPTGAPVPLALTLGKTDVNTITGTHVTFSSLACAGTGTPILSFSNGAALATPGPALCYDGSASFTPVANGSSQPQYYTVISLTAGTQTVTSAVVAPLFVPAPTTPSACIYSNGVTGNAFCQQIAEFGLGEATATIGPTPTPSSSPAASNTCGTDFTVSSYGSNGQSNGNTATNGGGKPTSSSISQADSNGYTEFAVVAAGSAPVGEFCQVTYTADSGAGAVYTYTVTAGGTGSGTINTIFGTRRRPASIRR